MMMPGDPARERLTRADRAVLVALVVVTCVAYGAFALLRHANFLTAGYDLGLFDQAVRGYAGFGAPISDLKGPGYNLLGNHFHPILAVLAPLYWIWDDPRVLLLAQVGLIAASIVPVYLMARARLDSWCAGLLGFAYAFSWPIQAMVDFDFHEVAFALPLLAWTVYLLDRRRYVPAVVVAAPLLLVREDMGLVLVAFAVVLALRRQWLLAAGTAVAGLGAYFVVTSVVIPALAPGTGFTYWTYDALGRDLPSAVGYALTHPMDVARLFVAGTKRRTLAALLLQTGFVSIASPYALLAAPFLAENFFSSRPALWSTGYHYTAPIIVVLVLALVDILGRLRGISPLVPRVMAGAIVLLVSLGTLTDRALFPLGNAPVLAAELDSVRVDNAHAALASVPSGVCVEADDRLVPHLTRTRDVLLPGRSGGAASWLVLDLAQHSAGGTPPVLSQGAFDAAVAEDFDVLATHGTFRVLHRPGANARSCR